MEEDYIIVEIFRASEYINVDYSFGRLSLDGLYLVWGQKWDPKVLALMEQDPGVRILNYNQVFEEMCSGVWSKLESN